MRPKEKPIRKGMLSKIFLLTYPGKLCESEIAEKLKYELSNISSYIKKHPELFTVRKERGRAYPRSKVKPLIEEIKNDNTSYDDNVRSDFLTFFDCPEFRDFMLIKVDEMEIIPEDAFATIIFSASLIASASYGIQKEKNHNIRLKAYKNDAELLKGLNGAIKKLPTKLRNKAINKIANRLYDENSYILNSSEDNIKYGKENIKKRTDAYFSGENPEYKKIMDLQQSLSIKLSFCNKKTVEILRGYKLRLEPQLTKELIRKMKEDK